MAKYHINPDSGRPNKCEAKIKCRFGGESDHYDSKEEARGVYEKRMKEQTISEGLKKNSENADRHAQRMAMQEKHNAKVSEIAHKEKIERESIPTGDSNSNSLDDKKATEAKRAARHAELNAKHTEELMALARKRRGEFDKLDQDDEALEEELRSNSRARAQGRLNSVPSEAEDDAAIKNRFDRREEYLKRFQKEREALAEKHEVELNANDDMEAALAKEAQARVEERAKTAQSLLPIVPGVPVVPTAVDLKNEMEDIVYSRMLKGYTVKDLLKTRNISDREIAAAEDGGDYLVHVKVPSGDVVHISTDLARRELGLKARQKTGIDVTPYRLAENEVNEAYEARLGNVMNPDEMKEATIRLKKSQEAFAVERKKKQDSENTADDFFSGL